MNIVHEHKVTYLVVKRFGLRLFESCGHFPLFVQNFFSRNTIKMFYFLHSKMFSAPLLVSLASLAHVSQAYCYYKYSSFWLLIVCDWFNTRVFSFYNNYVCTDDYYNNNNYYYSVRAKSSVGLAVGFEHFIYFSILLWFFFFLFFFRVRSFVIWITFALLENSVTRWRESCWRRYELQ